MEIFMAENKNKRFCAIPASDFCLISFWAENDTFLAVTSAGFDDSSFFFFLFKRNCINFGSIEKQNLLILITDVIHIKTV